MMFNIVHCDLQAIFAMVLVVLCVVMTMFYLYYICRKPSLPTIHCADTKLNQHLLNTVPRLRTRFTPPWLLSNRHVQTFLGCGVFHTVHFKREYLDLKDGGVIALDWLNLKSGVDLPDAAPVLVVLDGLTGTKTSILYITKLASERNYRVVAFNKRGHNNSKLTTPVLQAFGDARDLRQCMEFVHRKYPSSKMATVGYSAGCGLITRYLGIYAGDTHITAAVLIDSGFNVTHLCLSNMSRFYERMLVSSLRNNVTRRHKAILSQVLDIDAVCKVSTLREFDYHVYCRMHGCRDVAELWTVNNAMTYIHEVEVPVLCVNSLDDPVCLASNITYELFQRPGWMLVTTARGGHCASIENWKMESWADKLALDYIQSVMEYQQDQQ